MPKRRQKAVGPSQSEIGTIAYKSWVDNGCPIGSSGRCDDLSGRTSNLLRGFCIEPEGVVTFRAEGHWEVWEREWVGGARWVGN